MTFKEDLGRLVDEVNSFMENAVRECGTPEDTVYKAMKYSLNAGGKRLRPVLMLAVSELLGVSKKVMIPYATAIEMIHTYSLIHDDLPAMDNDDFRRGKPSCHKMFGEGMAILAGDALLNRAFEIMLDDISKENDRGLVGRKAMAAAAISYASGTRGMIGGQVVDLEAEGKEISPERLMYMHKCKTGALIGVSVKAPAIIGGIDGKRYNALEEYADAIGIAFQIKDDIMDVECTFKEMGKAAGSDFGRGKSTFITLFGLEKSRKRLDSEIERAICSLNIFEKDACFLSDLARYIAERRK